MKEDYIKFAIMVTSVAFLFFLMSPGIIINTGCDESGNPKKSAIILNGFLFGIILVFSYSKIEKIIYKN
jgi:hypothetical protein